MFLRNKADAPIDLYASPISYTGINIGSWIALKRIAERIADSGLLNFMIFNGANAGIIATNNAGIIAKYLATSLAILKVVSVPLVINSCFPISTTSISFVG